MHETTLNYPGLDKDVVIQCFGTYLNLLKSNTPSSLLLVLNHLNKLFQSSFNESQKYELKNYFRKVCFQIEKQILFI